MGSMLVPKREERELQEYIPDFVNQEHLKLVNVQWPYGQRPVGP